MATHVIDKIAKLLRLAEGRGTTAAESATAAAQAQRLMDRHRLSRAAVDIHQAPEPLVRAARPIFTGRRMVQWRKLLAAGVGRTNDCRLLLTREKTGEQHLDLIGTQADIQVATYLFAYLAPEIERLSKLALAERYFYYVGEARRWGNSFRHAAVAEVVRRLQLVRRQMHREARSGSSSQAMVKLEEQQLRLDEFASQCITSKAKPRPAVCAFNSEARAAGRRAGSSIELRSGLQAAPGVLPQLPGCAPA